MSCASSCCGVSPSAETLPTASKLAASATARTTKPFRDMLFPTLLGVLHRDHFDLDQKAGIGERGDADDSTRRQVGLRAAEELGVAVYEGLEIHRRSRGVNQKHLHLDHVAHAKAKTFEDGLDAVE